MRARMTSVTLGLSGSHSETIARERPARFARLSWVHPNNFRAATMREYARGFQVKQRSRRFSSIHLSVLIFRTLLLHTAFTLFGMA